MGLAVGPRSSAQPTEGSFITSQTDEAWARACMRLRGKPEGAFRHTNIHRAIDRGQMNGDSFVKYPVAQGTLALRVKLETAPSFDFQQTYTSSSDVSP
jgi:hypothetical protein